MIYFRPSLLGCRHLCSAWFLTFCDFSQDLLMLVRQRKTRAKRMGNVCYVISLDDAKQVAKEVVYCNCNISARKPMSFDSMPITAKAQGILEWLNDPRGVLLLETFVSSGVINTGYSYNIIWSHITDSHSKITKIHRLPRNCSLQPGVKKHNRWNMLCMAYLQDARPPTRKISSSSLEAHGKSKHWSLIRKNTTKTQKEELKGMNWVEWTNEKPEQQVGITSSILIHVDPFCILCTHENMLQHGMAPGESICGSCM